MSSTFEFDPDKVQGSGITTRGTAGETLGNRNLVYQGNDGSWYLADANAAATMPVIGLTVHGITSGQWGHILLHGYIGLATWTWNPGGLLYASTIAGQLTQTAPVPPNFTQIVGVATTATQIYFNPFPPSEGLTVETKEHFEPAPNPDSTVGDHSTQQMADGVSTYIHNEILIPNDFHQLTAAHIIVTQGTAATPNMVWTCDTDWGEICVGEDYFVHSDTMSAVTQMPQDDLVCLNITNALDGIAANDLVGVSFLRRGGHASDTVGGPVFYLGIRLRYV